MARNAVNQKNGMRFDQAQEAYQRLFWVRLGDGSKDGRQPPATPFPGPSGEQAASLFEKVDGLRLERAGQGGNRVIRIAIAAHKQIDGGEVSLRPCVNRDMTFREHQDATDPAIGREMVEMTMQDRRAGGIRRCA